MSFPSSWAQSLRSDTHREFINPQYPNMGDTITIRVRCLPNSELISMGCRLHIDGHEKFLPMAYGYSQYGFDYFELELLLDQPKLSYSFVAQVGDLFYFYTRQGVTEYHQNEDYNFILLANLQVPQWVPGSTFYQIFPDRFFQANPQNGVKTGAYTHQGFQSLAAKWHEPPREYHQAGCVDFYGGDLDGIREKLPYLEDLGISAIYLNPIFQAKTNHRYGCTDYWQVDPHLGGNEALIALTKNAHQRNIKIILDVSINHTGIDHPWFLKALEDPESEEHGYYYWDDQGNPLGWEGVPDLPQLNHTNPRVQELFYGPGDSLVLHYLREPYAIDGWRFDVAGHTGNRGKDQLSTWVWRQVRNRIKSEFPQALILGEHWEPAQDYLQGDQWDSAMNYFGSGRPLRRFLGLIDRFMSLDEQVTNLYPAMSGTSVWHQISSFFFRIPNQLTWYQYNLLNSHDIWRVHNHPKAPEFSLYKGVITTLFLLPGTFSVYYGDERSIPGWVETTEGARYPMNWDSKVQEPYQLFQRLAKIKKQEELLHTGTLELVYSDEETIILGRWIEYRMICSVLNRSTKAKKILFTLEHLGFVRNLKWETLGLPGQVPLKVAIQTQEDGREIIQMNLEPLEQQLVIVEYEL